MEVSMAYVSAPCPVLTHRYGTALGAGRALRLPVEFRGPASLARGRRRAGCASHSSQRIIRAAKEEKAQSTSSESGTLYRFSGPTEQDCAT